MSRIYAFSVTERNNIQEAVPPEQQSRKKAVIKFCFLLGESADKFERDGNYAIISAVEAGYHAEKKGTGTKGNQGSAAKDDALLKDTETPKLKKRLFASVGFYWY